MVDNYLEKVYSGFLGMNVGIRLGAPVEPTLWTYERIRDTYKDITSYVKYYKNFAADDDANGPYYFLRSLYDKKENAEIEPNDVANAWLNYTRENAGMFWWGGYGISTEHTAYLNLKNGIKAPTSGKIEQNGLTMAEQIGGQIFIDTWGLITPNNPEKAANLGAIAASVSHDGEGLNGARFFCACISHAFVCNDIEEIIEVGLKTIDSNSLYTKVSRAVLDFYKENPSDFRKCRDMLEADYGYDKYKGICHIIPNAGVCVLSMIYGQGNFDRTVEIATMCGWDTDCNAGNVGTVLGVMCGIEGIGKHYLEPINDSIVLSGVSGYLNILDIPTYAKELCILGYKQNKLTPPKDLVDSFKEDEIYFDFELPNSTHNIRISDTFFGRAEHAFEKAYSGKGSLKVYFDRMIRGDSFKLYYKPFYTRDEFSDERYSPVFSGKVYSGQICTMKIYQDQWNGNENMLVAPFVRLAHSNEEIRLGYIKLTQEEWTDIEFVVPDTAGSIIDEIGLIVEGTGIAKAKNLGALYIDDIHIFGNSEYTIDISKQKVNFGNVTPFSSSSGAWNIEENGLHCMSLDDAFNYTGNYFSKNYKLETTITPLHGVGHMLNFRTKGIMQGYFMGFDEIGKLSFYKNDFGYTKLFQMDYDWKHNVLYNILVIAENEEFTVYINDEKMFSLKDNTYDYGMYGFGRLKNGRTLFGNIKFTNI